MTAHRLSTLERAFQLAASGDVENVASLRRILVREGYGDARAQTDGPAVIRQLAALIAGGQSGSKRSA